MHIFTNTI